MSNANRLAVAMVAGLGSAALSYVIMNTPAPVHAPQPSYQPPSPPAPKKKERVYH